LRQPSLREVDILRRIQIAVIDDRSGIRIRTSRRGSGLMAEPGSSLIVVADAHILRRMIVKSWTTAVMTAAATAAMRTAIRRRKHRLPTIITRIVVIGSITSFGEIATATAV